MLIIPAIDLMNGRCVRLKQGRFDEATRYGDPLAQLAGFARAGAEWVHVVDLDGARDGARRQSRLIAELAQRAPLKIQCGGGVRSRADVETLLEASVARVVVGSTAVKAPQSVSAWIDEFGPEKICCAFDVAAGDRGFEVRVYGWTEGSGIDLNEAINAYGGTNLKHVLITDIARDGVLSGPNVALMKNVARRHLSLKAQASGGVSSLDDLAALRAAGADAAIIGRALYENCFTLEDALAG